MEGLQKRNGTFTQEERAYLLSLDAVEDVRARSIIYSKNFKEECMRRYHAGEKPSAIFASAGLPSSLVGYKRIERAIYHWKEADKKGSLLTYDAYPLSHKNRIDTIKREKCSVDRYHLSSQSHGIQLSLGNYRL